MQPEARAGDRAAEGRLTVTISDELKFYIRINGQWVGPWFTTTATKSRLYFYRPDYDGDNRMSRKLRWREWWEGIATRTIRLAVKHQKARRIIKIAQKRIREMDAESSGAEP